MRLFYVGRSAGHSSSWQRAAALMRAGHDVTCFDPFRAFSAELESRLPVAFHFRTGYRFLQKRMAEWLKRTWSGLSRPDVIWIDGGEFFGPECLKVMTDAGTPVVVYNLDDPTGRRDGRRFDQLRRSLPFYSLAVTVRPETEKEMSALGARRVLRVWRSYDELIHAPVPQSEIPDGMRSEAAFIGTWMPGENRDEFLLDLKSRGVPVSIWGDAWQKAPQWKKLAGSWRGPSLKNRDYATGIGGAKLCLGLLARQNRDHHTQRSAEIPFAGGLFCAERTGEHLELYAEGREAAFWSDAAECATLCRELLADPAARERIRLGGMERVRRLKVGNEDVCQHVLQVLLGRSAVTV